MPHSTRDSVLEAYERLGRNKAAVARELGLARSTVVVHVQKGNGDEGKPLFSGRVPTMEVEDRALPKNGKIATYILTSAQNNTPVHPGFWRNLKALATYHDAELMVSQFTYNKAAYAEGEVKPGKEPTAEDYDSLWYAPETVAYKCNKRVRLAPDFLFCGESNVPATAVNPLSGYETYTGTDSCAIPHTKIALRSIPRAKGKPAKMNYTTGACTMRNYIAKKAGQKAEFHHAFGALIVQVDSEGDWFARQINASNDGTFYDLFVQVKDGKVTLGNWCEAIIWGDIHASRLDPMMREICWGKGGILDQLRAKRQFFHDLHDHRNRNHHDAGDPHLAYHKFVNGHESVEAELYTAGDFLAHAHRGFCESVVVASNHDAALTKWLRNGDYRTDQINAEFFLEGNLEIYRAIRKRQSFYAPEWAIRRTGVCPKQVRFLRIDESYKVKGIECGDHGHNGPNGLRGSAAAMARMGSKAIQGHAHTACIIDGLYVVGVMGSLDMGYNPGASSWSHTFAIIYPNGKRALVTFRGMKWRATKCRNATRRTSMKQLRRRRKSVVASPAASRPAVARRSWSKHPTR